MIKQEKKNRLAILHESQGTSEDTNFAKKLIDVFTPDVLHLEMQPHLQLSDKEEVKSVNSVDNTPNDNSGVFKKETEIYNLIEGRTNKCNYKLEGEEIEGFLEEFKNRFNVEILNVTDENEDSSEPTHHQTVLAMPGLMNYFHGKFTPHRPVVLSDMTEDEKSHDFILQTSDQKKHSIKRYLNSVSLLSHTSWFYQTNNTGCGQCSSFLNKGNIIPWPTPSAELLNEKLIDQSKREMLMAYHMHQTLKDKTYNKKFPEEKTNFLMLWKELNFLKIAKYLCDFISDKNKIKEFEDSFMQKYRNPQEPDIMRNDSLIEDSASREGLLQKWALYYTISSHSQYNTPYFKITEAEKLFVEAHKIKYLWKQSLIEHIEQIDEMPLVIEEEDYEDSELDYLLLNPQPQNDIQNSENQ